MDFEKILKSIDAKDVENALGTIANNHQQLGNLPGFIGKLADGLHEAGDQASSAGIALIGEDGTSGMRGTLGSSATSIAAIVKSLEKGVDLLGDAAAGISKVPMMDGPASRFTDAAKEIGSATGHLGELSEALDSVADTLGKVGEALDKLGKSLGDTGGEARSLMGG